MNQLRRLLPRQFQRPLECSLGVAVEEAGGAAAVVEGEVVAGGDLGEGAEKVADAEGFGFPGMDLAAELVDGGVISVAADGDGVATDADDTGGTGEGGRADEGGGGAVDFGAPGRGAGGGIAEGALGLLDGDFAEGVEVGAEVLYRGEVAAEGRGEGVCGFVKAESHDVRANSNI